MVRYLQDRSSPISFGDLQNQRTPDVIRLSRITDYGIVLMVELACSTDGEAHNARNLAAETELPLPVVSKVLKSLARAGLLASQRGSKGGYTLARRASEITVPEMIWSALYLIDKTACTNPSRPPAATAAKRPI